MFNVCKVCLCGALTSFCVLLFVIWFFVECGFFVLLMSYAQFYDRDCYCCPGLFMWTSLFCLVVCCPIYVFDYIFICRVIVCVLLLCYSYYFVVCVCVLWFVWSWVRNTSCLIVMFDLCLCYVVRCARLGICVFCVCVDCWFVIYRWPCFDFVVVCYKLFLFNYDFVFVCVIVLHRCCVCSLCVFV